MQVQVKATGEILEVWNSIHSNEEDTYTDHVTGEKEAFYYSTYPLGAPFLKEYGNRPALKVYPASQVTANV
jgi:hypothetical protein